MNETEPARAVIRARRVTSASKNRGALQKNVQVVGTIPSPDALRCALRLRHGAVDFFELRADHFASDPGPLLRAVPRLCAPLIVTVRHSAEGGAGALSLSQRRVLYAQFLPVAKFIDVELRSVRALAGVIADARACGVKLIVSAHFFKSTPSLARLETLRERAFAAGADVFKVATLTRTLPDVLTLASLLVRSPGQSLSVMGMGEFGKLSRTLLACGGSVLNYGFLDAVQVPGQWPAPLLKERLSEFC